MGRICRISSIRARRMLSGLSIFVLADGRYLPGVTLPDNIVAIPDIETVAKDADILIFNFPHQVNSSLSVLIISLPAKSAAN
jgi:glycerol-3-phosphate dehydrogenase